jgi:mannose-6-phosphate isomerase-like protein (cupin superfamily)
MRVHRALDQPLVPASHEDPSRPGVLKRVLATRDDLLSGRVQMINWAVLPIGASFRAHYHEDMEETFVMLRGQAAMRVADASVTLGPGDSIQIAPREIHTMINTGSEDVEYLVVGISLGQGGKTIVVDSPST